MKYYLGILIVAAFFIGLFMLVARIDGYITAAAIIAGSTAIALILTVAIKWIVEGR